MPVFVGSAERAVRHSDAVFRPGIDFQPFRAPSVERGRARLRFFLTADHAEALSLATIDAVAEGLAKLPPGGEELPCSPWPVAAERPPR